jgi:glycosyltransferase involved in cell wall biosynthesis
MSHPKETFTKNELRQEIEKMGWCCLDEKLWERLDEFKTGIAILAPPLDTVPSPQGNAIYTIIQDLAARSPVPCLVLSVWPEHGEPKKCEISDRILYLTKPFKPVLLESYIPYRVKKWVWGIGRPELLSFPQKAAYLCNVLNFRTIIVEDVPRFGLPIKKTLPSGSKIFLHQHNNAPLKYPKFWWRVFEKYFTGIIFVSRQNLLATEHKFGKLRHAEVVYNGVDLRHFDPDLWEEKSRKILLDHSISKEELVILYVGRIIPGKGCLELAQAFLKANIPNVRLILVGEIKESLFSDVDFIAKMKRVISQSSGKIISVGNIAQDSIPGFYNAADLVVIPSIQSEGLPKVVTEALVMGKPILGTDRGGIFELIKHGENGYLLQDPQDIEQFSNQLQEILHNKERLLILKQNALLNDRFRLSINQSANDFFNFIFQENN